MLTAHETAQLRANAQRGQRRRVGKRIPASFIGGPLDRLTIAIEAMAAKSYRLAWAHIRETGAVQAMYKPCGEGRWCFDGWETYDAGGGYPE